MVDGDGQGLVNAAAAGLLADNPTIFYSASAAGSPESPSSLKSQLARGAVLVAHRQQRQSSSRPGAR